jgi:hypothetical protein
VRITGQQVSASAVERNEHHDQSSWLARLGMLAVGLGIGATVASTPGIASADGLDFQISIDGYDPLPTAGHSATATSDMGDFAIAFGNGATATAVGGTGDFAMADGNDAVAGTGGNSDTAIDNVVSGINDLNPGNFDFGATLFDDNVLNQGASGVDYLYDIVTTLGIESNSLAAASTDWWADLLALF